MSLAPPHLDYNSNTYLTVYLPSSSPYLADPSAIATIHPALKHVGPVGVMKDIQILSVPKIEWERVSGEVLASFGDKLKDGIHKVELLDEPKARVKRGGDEL